jgi:hypothetical protein
METLGGKSTSSFSNSAGALTVKREYPSLIFNFCAMVDGITSNFAA